MVQKNEVTVLLTKSQINKLKKGKGIRIKITDLKMDQQGGFFGSLVKAVAPTLIREGSKFAGEKLAQKVEGSGMLVKRTLPEGLRKYQEERRKMKLQKGEGVVGDLLKKARKPLGGLAKKGVKALGELASDKLGDIVEKGISGEGLKKKTRGGSFRFNVPK